MKKYLTVFITLYCLQLSHHALAQTRFETLYEDRLSKGSKLEIKDAIQAQDGNIYMVGRVATSSNGMDGVLFKMDASGKVEELRKYGDGFDDELCGIIQLPNGPLLLGGSTIQSAKGKKAAWLLRVNYDGNQLDKSIIDKPGQDIQITHLSQNELGTILLCGTSEAKKVKNCWVNPLPRTKTLPNQLELALMGPTYADITYLGKFYNDNFLVCGNYDRKKGKQYKTWYNLYSPSGQKIPGKEQNLPATSDLLVGGNLNMMDGTIALIGHTKRVNSFSDIHILQIDENGQIVRDTFWAEQDIDLAKGILPTLEPGLILLALRSSTAQGYRNMLVFLNPETKSLQKEQGEIKISRLLVTADNHLVGIGTVKDRTDSYLWRLGMRQKEYTGGEKDGSQDLSAANFNRKGKAKDITALGELVTCGPATFLDDNDNLLLPDETGRLAFSVENKSSAAITGLRVEARARGTIVEGLSFVPSAFVQPIPPGRKGTAKISVSGAANLKPGTSTVELILKIDGKELCRTTSQIKSQIVGKTTGGTITALSPSTQRTDKPQGVINGRYVTGTQTGNTKVKIVHNNTQLSDSKASVGEQKRTDVDKFITDYSISLPLDPGPNKFVVKIVEDGVEVDSMMVTIERIMRKPSLHLLGIAPTYSDLNFNRNDVQDFKTAVLAQQKSGLYDTVYVQTLTTREDTDKGNLEIVFEDLLQRSNQNYQEANRIDPEDVVIVFISSHGKIIEQSFRIIPSNFRSQYENTTSLNLQDMINRFLSKMECKIILLIDACHSGGARDLELSIALNTLMSAAPGQFILTSSSEAELSYEDSAWNNGAFTEALIEALGPKAQTVDLDKDGFISPAELSTYAKNRVPELVKAIGRKQTPKTPKQEKEMDLKLPLFKVGVYK